MTARLRKLAREASKEVPGVHVDDVQAGVQQVMRDVQEVVVQYQGKKRKISVFNTELQTDSEAKILGDLIEEFRKFKQDVDKQQDKPDTST